MIRVGFNALWLVPGVVGGSEDATVRLLAACNDELLAEFGVELVLFALPSLLTAYPWLADRFTTIEAPVSGASKPRRVAAESLWLPAAARRAGVDVMHHGGGVHPPGYFAASTTTVHDLQPLELARNFSFAKRRYLSAMLGPTVRRSRSVVVPSAFTASRVVALLGASPERVHVVPWAAPVPPDRSEGVADLPGGLRDGDPFVLYPAVTYVHKNHDTLLDAFARFAVDRPDWRLVLIGGVGGNEPAVAERIGWPDLAGRVLRLGRVSDGQRDALMAQAAIVAVPSEYEGFGIPALEAMSAGIPVVVADAGSLPEVVGPGVPRVAPRDVAAWAQTLGALADDPSLRAELSALGRGQAARFTPAATARAMLELWVRARRSL